MRARPTSISHKNNKVNRESVEIVLDALRATVIEWEDGFEIVEAVEKYIRDNELA